MQEDYEYWILLLVNKTLVTKIAFNASILYRNNSCNNKRLTWSFNFFSSTTFTLHILFSRLIRQ